MISIPSTSKSYIAEFFASFIFCFAISMAQGNKVPNVVFVVTFVKIAISFAFENLTLKYTNPAITFAVAVIGLLNIKQALKYIFFQICGFIAGSGLSRFLLGKNYIIVYQNTQSQDLHQLFFLELCVNITTSIIITENIIFSNEITTYNRKLIGGSFRRDKTVLMLVIGPTIGLTALISSASEGGIFNPGFVISTFLISNKYRFLWGYLLSDFTGSIIGSLIVKHLLLS
ncbi:hypothetical protein NUSPORA_02684 [Nucleospora cyclopteri]